VPGVTTAVDKKVASLRVKQLLWSGSIATKNYISTEYDASADTTKGDAEVGDAEVGDTEDCRLVDDDEEENDEEQNAQEENAEKKAEVVASTRSDLKRTKKSKNKKNKKQKKLLVSQFTPRQQKRYLSGHYDSTVFSSLQKAFRACISTKGCTGVTQEGPNRFTLRLGTIFYPSPSAEDSWMRLDLL
jgi:hypothetical protein